MYEMRTEKRSRLTTGFGIIIILFLDYCLDQRLRWGDVVYNQGGIWGWGSDYWWWSWLVGLALLYIAYLWIRTRNFWSQWGYAIILAAGISNLLDRVLYGGVMDYIFYPSLSVYGNIADILLGVGIFILIFPRKGYDRHTRSL